jgi:hypothetical protein
MADEGEEKDDFEIEIVDDTPEEDKNRPRRPEGVEPEIPSDDEIEQYSESVQKRIKKLKYEFHEERRRADEERRQKEEAIAFAQRERAEAEALRARLQKGDETIVSQAQLRVKSELEQAKAKLRAAYEAGDADGVVEANATLAALSAEASRLSSFKPRPAQPAQQPAQQFVPQVQAPPPPSPRAADWANKNGWFGKDEEMTALAFGVHERIIRQGVAPDSEEYYNQIDAAIRQRFPDKVATEVSAPRRQPSSVVAPGGRASPSSPRKVVLTASEVSIARRLGLTPEQYAAQKFKEQRKNG